jgi:hypothetical protein
MLEVQEALENYTIVLFKLFPLDPTAHNLRRTLLYNNHGGQLGEDEKGRLRCVGNIHAREDGIIGAGIIPGFDSDNKS